MTTKMLENAIAKIRQLPEERQAAAAEALEIIAAQPDDDALSSIEIEGVKQAQRAVRKGEPVKVLGNGDLGQVKLDITANAFSDSAREKIVAAGGTVTQL